MGQNLAYTYMPRGGAVNLTRMVDLWVQQNTYYDYGTDTCERDFGCGQYTQVIWADTTRVRCNVVMLKL